MFNLSVVSRKNLWIYIGRENENKNQKQKQKNERMNPSIWQSCGQRKAKPCTHGFSRHAYEMDDIAFIYSRTPINACYDLRQKNKRITCILETTAKIVSVFLRLQSIQIYGGLFFFLFIFFLLLLEFNKWMNQWLKARVSWI